MRKCKNNLGYHNPDTQGLIELSGLALVFESIILVLFLILKGLTIWPVGEKPNQRLVEFTLILRTLMFLVPFVLLLYVSLSYTFIKISEEQRLTNYVIQLINYGIGFISIFVPFYLSGSFSFRSSAPSSRELIKFWSIILVFSFILILSLPLTMVLLSGTYSIDVAYSPNQAWQEKLSVTIKDTGIPSNRCWVTLNK